MRILKVLTFIIGILLLTVACGSGGGGGGDDSSGFSGLDTTPPSLISSDPLNSATNEPLDKETISFTFDEAMGVGQSVIWAGAIDIAAIINSISWSADNKTIVYTLNANLPAPSVITWVLNPGTDSLNFKDLAGNHLPATEGSFTTQP